MAKRPAPQSPPPPEPTVDVGGIAVDQLRAFIERIERLEEEKAGIASDIKDVFAEAKGNGFDVKTIRQVLRLRKLEEIDRQEQETLLDLYKRALGMADDLPDEEEDA
jgi:uncharacterized protein (UPF0335 family)